MADIAIIHEKVEWGGGGSVFMHIAQALQEKHNLSLITTRCDDIERMNRYYGTRVNDLKVHEVKTLSILDKTGRMRTLGESILSRLADSLSKGKDLVINTSGDIKVNKNSITYLHYPSQIKGVGESSVQKGLKKYYFQVCKMIESGGKNKTEYLANSEWTAEGAKEKLSKKPRVIYPPVRSERITPKSWNNKKDKILTIGRISPKKNLIRNIKIVSDLRELGHKMEYHIVGPRSNDNEEYVEKVLGRINSLEYVTYEGKIPRGELNNMLSTFKYGIHGHNREHFGIVVAELVAGGIIPFVPNNGGQVEIVNNCSKIIYSSRKDAVKKINQVMSDEKKREKVKRTLPNIKEKFGVQRFENEIKSVVEGEIFKNESISPRSLS